MIRRVVCCMLLAPGFALAADLSSILGEGVTKTAGNEIVQALEQGLMLSKGEYTLIRLDPIPLKEIVRITSLEEGYEVTVGYFPGCGKILELKRKCNVKSLECIWYTSPDIQRLCT